MSTSGTGELHTKAGLDMHVLDLQAAQGPMARSLPGLMARLLGPRQVTSLLVFPAAAFPLPCSCCGAKIVAFGLLHWASYQRFHKIAQNVGPDLDESLGRQSCRAMHCAQERKALSSQAPRL